ncbi:MAG: CinA family protein [Gammaproteobacteria bacterium]|nr:CinA family protein [Gammaproteobacteria bacterium]MDH4255255.1 CinA family protein [Gammaproteobacteria bacterium]MDH5311265.1 CinA family protein [Gammaproteobacteria bacterium]
MADETAIGRLATDVVAALTRERLWVATAESCTGGWIGKALTDIPGSSRCFGYGIVSYSFAAKRSLLGVRAATLKDHGAVSEQTVREMALGVLELSGAAITVAVSGIAGPDGGSADKPVGTVWFAWARKGDERVQVDAERRRFEGGRADVRMQTVAHALAGILARIPGDG